MKRSKTERTEAILEFVLEIVFTIIGLGVGFLVYNLLGIDVGENTDYEWLSLVGIIVFLVVLGGILSLVEFIKKKNGKAKGKENKNEENTS